MTKKKETQGHKENNEMQTRKLKTENIITVLVVLVVLIVAAFGLWKLSGESDKPSQMLVFTVGTEEVYQDEINLCILQNMIALGVDTEHLDTKKTEDGTPAAEHYKQQILEVIMDYKVECMIAKEQGITLTDEEEKEVLLDVVEYMSQVDARLLNHWGITQDLMEDVYRQRYLAHKLEETVRKEVEVDNVQYSTIYLMLFPKVEMNEDGSYVTEEDGETPVMLSDSAIKQRKEDADKALAELQDGADVVEVAKKYGVDSYSGEESNTPDSFGEPFSDCVKQLKQGEYSSVIDIQSAYAIVKMIEKNNEKLASEIREHYQTDLEKEAIEKNKVKWYEKLGIGSEPVFEGKLWENISLYDYVQ